MENENGKKIQMIEDIASLKTEVGHVKEALHDYPEMIRSLVGDSEKRIVNAVDELRAKVNDEITTMTNNIKAYNENIDLQIKTIKKTQKQQYKKLTLCIIIAFSLGCFLWIPESRNWIFKMIGFVL